MAQRASLRDPYTPVDENVSSPCSCSRRPSHGGHGCIPRSGGDAAEHAAKNEAVERIEDVPVGEAEEAGRIEYRGLADLGPARSGRDLKLQPSPARNPHLGAQTQKTVRLDGFDAPEVEGIALLELVRMAAAAAETDAPGEEIQESAQPPEEVAVIPASVCLLYTSPSPRDRT